MRPSKSAEVALKDALDLNACAVSPLGLAGEDGEDYDLGETDLDIQEDMQGRTARVFVARVGAAGLKSQYQRNTTLPPGTLVAVKTPITPPKSFDTIEELQQELGLWLAVNGAKNIVRLHAVYPPDPATWGTTDEPVCFIAELCEAGNVRDALCSKQWDDTPKIDVPALAQDLASAVAQCHEAGLVHRDIKTPNALLTWDYEQGRTVCKLCDMGSAVRMTDAQAVAAKWCELTPEEQRSKRREQKRIGWKPSGTLLWMAPEALTPYWEKRDEVLQPETADAVIGAEAARASDVWALGVCVWEMLARQLPLLPSAGLPPTRDTWRDTLASGERWPLPEGTSSELAAWLAACWLDDVASRPSAEDAQTTLAALGDNWDSNGMVAATAAAAREELSRRGRAERWKVELTQCHAKFGGRCEITVDRDMQAPSDRRITADGERVDVKTRAAGAPMEVRFSGVIVGVRSDSCAEEVDEAWRALGSPESLEPGTAAGEGYDAADIDALVDLLPDRPGWAVRERGEPAFFDMGGCTRAPARPRVGEANLEIAFIVPSFPRESGFILRCVEGHDLAVRVNRTRIEPGEAVSVAAGDSIRVGRMLVDLAAVPDSELEAAQAIATIDDDEIGEPADAVLQEEEEEEEDPATPDDSNTKSEAVLLWVDGASGEAKRLELEPDIPGEIKIGRDPMCDVRLSGCDAVSRLHCKLKYERGAFRITDVSANGTSVNGKRLRSGRPRALVSGDEIKLATGDKGAQISFVDV